MEFKYMLVCFLDDMTVGSTVEPPKYPHITVKKKFRLRDINEDKLINIIESNWTASGARQLRLGESCEYGGPENQYIGVLDQEPWHELHENTLRVLEPHIQTRDTHFEESNYLPHVTWKLKGEITLDPKSLINKTFDIKYLYVIKRVAQTESRALILAKIAL